VWVRNLIEKNPPSFSQHEKKFNGKRMKGCREKLVGFVLKKVKFARKRVRVTIKHEEEEKGEEML
jgi:hypothetical protein